MYKDLKAVSEDFGISLFTLHNRMYTGYTAEEAINMEKTTGLIVLFDKEHKDIESVAKYYGLDVDLFKKSLIRGVEPEECMLRLLKKEQVTFAKKRYPDFKSLCDTHKISVTSATNRLKRGWSLSETLLVPISDGRKPNTYLYKGGTYKTKLELAEAYGFGSPFVSSWARNFNLDFLDTLDVLDEFFSKYKGNRPEMIKKLPSFIYKDKWIKNVKDLCVELNVNVLSLSKYMADNHIRDHVEALHGLRKAKSRKLVDVETGKAISQLEAQVKYNQTLQTLELNGIVRYTEVLDFPYCRLKDGDYIMSIKQDMHKLRAEKYGG
jgi:hypothetical protein